MTSRNPKDGAEGEEEGKKILVSDVIEHCISFVVKRKVVETARTHEQTIKKKKKIAYLFALY